jgi:hypothetical protein
MLLIGFRKAVLFQDWERKHLPEVWDTAVNVFSGFGGFAHSELIFDGGIAYSSLISFAGMDIVLPDEMSDRKEGPAFFRRQYRLPLWEFREIPCRPDQEWAVRQRAVQVVNEGGGYDRMGCLRFVFPWVKDHPEDWFCSETTWDALQPAGLAGRYLPHKVHPNKMRRWSVSRQWPVVDYPYGNIQ